MSHVPAVDRAPPRRLPHWLASLVGTPLNASITLAFLALVWLIGWPFVRWAVLDATWSGTAETCAAAGGACWAFVAEKARFLAFAIYPQAEDWRPALATLALAILMGLTAWPRLWGRNLIALWLAAFALVIWLMGGGAGLSAISTEKWGGLPVTLMLALGAFAGAFPLAVVLALMRRSRHAGFRLVAVGFIETVRGVPFITILYAATLLFPLMLPAGASLDKFLRASVALALFVAAYLAEIIRAGLQAVPNGQSEAAAALGLTHIQTLRLIVLPQALKLVIPPMVNLAIGIFQDTTLVIIIGMYDVLNAARTAATDPQWLGFYNEAYAVVAAFYFVTCFAASRYSLWLERRVAPERTR